MKISRYLLLFLIGILLVTTTTVFAQGEVVVTGDSPLEQVQLEEENLELTPTELKFIEADRLYLTGDVVSASALYRDLKPPFKLELAATTETIVPPLYDAALLPVKASVYWRLGQEAWHQEQKLETKILLPLKLLIEEDPEFIPGQLLYAETLKYFNQPQQALEVLEKASAKYDDQPDLLKATITTLAENEQWLEASLMARQFALLNQNNPQSQEFQELADQNLQQYQRYLRSELTGNAIANVLTGAIGYFVTKNLWGPFTTVQTIAMLLQGESAVGEGYTNYLKEKALFLEDKEIISYVEKIGYKLANFTGRNEFNYEFYILMDDQLNAFALPGGKIFINAGALIKTNSEAEIAGLLAHELSHAVLSHGFQLMTQGNLTSNLLQAIPYGDTVANLVVLNYSRDMEKQADILGTKILVSSGYAADGLRNLTNTLDQENKGNNFPQWFLSHPTTGNRISYLEELIIKNGYNRYAYEGVLEHHKIKHKTTKIISEFKEKKATPQQEDKS